MLSYRFALKSLLSCFALLVQPYGAHAQYQWKDENGRMVFSDKGPPSSVQYSNAVRIQPGRDTSNNNLATNAAPAPPPSGTATAKTPGRETLADRELDAKRKAKDKADADRKKKEDAEQTAKLDRACEEMKAEARTLESGVRAVTVNEQGEREFVSDVDRERRLDRIRRDIRDSCKAG